MLSREKKKGSGIFFRLLTVHKHSLVKMWLFFFLQQDTNSWFAIQRNYIRLYVRAMNVSVMYPATANAMD